MLSKTYFAIDERFTPGYWYDRIFHGFCLQTEIMLHQRKLNAKWTKRADKALNERCQPLTLELQLYFSCVVKKRVIFHERKIEGASKIKENLFVIFRLVQAESCDPEEFAKNYPESRELDNTQTKHISAKKLSLDYKNKQWRAEFSI